MRNTPGGAWKYLCVQSILQRLTQMILSGETARCKGCKYRLPVRRWNPSTHYGGKGGSQIGHDDGNGGAQTHGCFAAL